MQFLRVFLLSLALLITMLTISQPQQRVSPRQRVSPQSSPPPETQKFSMPEGINTNTEVLPFGFVGVNPQSAVEWFKKSLSQIPMKIDQYSTATERAQFDQLRAQQFNSLGLLPFTLLAPPLWPGQCQKKYNPDEQLFSFALYPERYPTYSELYKLKMSKLFVFKESKSLGDYEASNAFGVRVTVDNKSEREISLAFPNEPPGMPQSIFSKQYSPFASKFTFTVQATPSEARESDKDIRCLALFRPSPPYILDYSDYMAPKIDFHMSISITGTALLGRIEQLWIFNQRSGKIYAKFN